MSIRNKKNLTDKHDFSNNVPIKTDAATCTENFTPGISQAPVFNIHIHVPSNNQINPTTMYLPKILPVIHVHFDELTKNLKKNSSEHSEGLHEKYFENLAKEITPKLGNVLLHHENNSCDRHFSENEMNIENQKQSLRKKNSSIEIEGFGTDETITMNKHNHSNVLDNNERIEGIGGNELPNVVVHNGRPIKLKKAVVILKDILKSNSYSSGGISNLLNCQKNESSNSLLNGVADYGPQIKTEPSTSSCENPAINENQCVNDDNSYLNSSNSSSFSDTVNSRFLNIEKSMKREILDSFVQGCNFSEILKKFKGKYGKNSIIKLENLLWRSMENSNKDGMVENDKATINGVAGLTQNETEKEAIEVDQSHDIDDQQQGELNYNRDELNLEGRLVSDETDNQPSVNSYEKFIKCDTEMNGVELSNSVTSSAEVVENGVDQIHGNDGNRITELSNSVTSFAEVVESGVDQMHGNDGNRITELSNSVTSFAEVVESGVDQMHGNDGNRITELRNSVTSSAEVVENGVDQIHGNDGNRITELSNSVTSFAEVVESGVDQMHGNDGNRITELSNSVTSSAEIVENIVDQIHGNDDNRDLINPFHEVEFMSDDKEITTKNIQSSDVVGDLETLEFDSSNCMSDIVIKSEFGFVERNDLILNDKEDFDLNLVKKEVVSPGKSSDNMAKAKCEKRNSGDIREDSFSPKKIKQSPKTSKKSATKASKDEDYIPLNIPGPTQFAVVPLSKVQVREAHASKNFKNDMLFGNRVKRFTNAEQQKVYKLKKQAAKTRSDQGGHKV